MVVFVAAVLHSRAPDLPEAAQQCGGVGRRERGVPLRCSRRPCSHCPLEKRWFWPAQGQVMHKGPLDALMYHESHGVSTPSFISRFCVSVLPADSKSWRTIPWLFAKWPLRMRAPIHAWWRTWLENLKHLPRLLYTVSTARRLHVMSSNHSAALSSVYSSHDSFQSPQIFLLSNICKTAASSLNEELIRRRSVTN